ncbi:MAG: hypothetical protein ACE5IP_07730 [Terriglobia bacterium]
MRSRIILLAFVAWLTGFSALAMQDVRAQSSGSTQQKEDTQSLVVPGQIAPRLQNLGDHTHPITTSSPRAQLFFNQGLNLGYGFNHREALRSFQEAARLDPECAMAYWGQALVLGPNINMPMVSEDEPKAYELVQKGMVLRSKAGERERAYIEALAMRYSGDPADRAERDRAYAEAMKKLAKRYPDDLDAATLYAEALMDLQPWNYWAKDGHPYKSTLEIVSVLESVLERNPDHPGANHLYIHAVEAINPALAEAAADRLRHLMPGAGHMVHMPSHIYIRVGRYHDASDTNVRAIAADEDYITQCRAQGIYPLGYYPHNVHFLWAAATMEGRSRVAIEAARKTASRIPEDKWDELPSWAQPFRIVPLFALTRFGKWDEILQEPRPAGSGFALGIWHYARGMALARTSGFDEAAAELESLRALAAEKELAKQMVAANTVGDILAIAAETVAGELAAEQGKGEEALSHLHRAVLLQDGLTYTEPPDWHYPVRQSLGAVLLQAGRAREAEVVYWQDLEGNPDNGWSLFGLLESLRAQGKMDQAAEIEKRFEKAWARADVKLSASRF